MLRCRCTLAGGILQQLGGGCVLCHTHIFAETGLPWVLVYSVKIHNILSRNSSIFLIIKHYDLYYPELGKMLGAETSNLEVLVF